MESGNKLASRVVSLGERFSSKSSFTGYKGGPAFPIRGKSQAGANILLGEVREIAQNLLVTHP